MSTEPSTCPPGLIHVGSTSSSAVARPLRSPRVHVAGEATPELSPLDAFALQSRLLAKQLEGSTREGRRMSRLPPLTTESPVIVQARSEYFRSMAQEQGVECPDGLLPLLPLHKLNMGPNSDIANDIGLRPKSVRPHLSHIPPTPADDPVLDVPLRIRNAARAIRLGPTEEEDCYFGIGARRELSPTPLERTPSSESAGLIRDTRGGTTVDSLPLPHPSQMSGYSMPTSPHRVPMKTSFENATLFPPRSLFPNRTSSIASSPLDSVESSSWGSSFHSQDMRKLSFRQQQPRFTGLAIQSI